jgi:transcriptional regulator with XRE-family HTH domain
MTNNSIEKLKSFRKMNNYSQEKMASFLGITRSSYTQIEIGNSGLQDSHLPKLIAIGVDLNWLFSDSIELMQLSEPSTAYISRAATQVQKTEDEIRQALAGALIEIGYLKQQVADKEEIITLMKKI